MGIYVTLINYTEQGIKGIKTRHTPETSMTAAVEAMGIKVLSAYVTIGQYDEIHIWEAPDDETAAGLLLGWGKRGNVKTVTLKALTIDQFRQIAAKLP